MGISLSEFTPQDKINLHNPDTWHNPHNSNVMQFCFSLLHLKPVLELQAKKEVITELGSHDLEKVV